MAYLHHVQDDVLREHTHIRYRQQSTVDDAPENNEVNVKYSAVFLNKLNMLSL